MDLKVLGSIAITFSLFSFFSLLSLPQKVVAYENLSTVL